MTTPIASTATMAHEHAIVIGGSMAGLLAARVLADHFERVTVVERDRFPAEPVTRKGVPQGRHVHILLLQGQQLLEGLFPGLDEELAAAGAPHMDMIDEFPLLGLGGWACRFPSPYLARTCSRPLLEWTVRRRLTEHANVHFLAERQVTGLLAASGGTRVAGVRLRPRGASDYVDQADEEMDAALVVDASGRTSHAPAWLHTLGYEPPRETVINSFLGYASRMYEVPAGFHAHWKGLLIGTKAPHQSRGGVLFPLERGWWMVTLVGVARDYPPTDDAAFLDFARGLRSPLLYDAIKDARPLTPIFGYQRTENRLRHYEGLRRWPAGLLVTGDAVCAFNPVYGQGMTAAARGAAALHRCLRAARTEGGKDAVLREGFGRRFQRELARANATPWLMATGEDFRWPTTEGGHPSLPDRLMHRYLDQIMILNSRSSSAYTTFVEVTHLLQPPATLLKPSLLAQVCGKMVLR